MTLKSIKSYKNRLFYLMFLISTALVLCIQGCQNEPSDIGINYITDDTLGTLIYDSNGDSSVITGNTRIKYSNTSTSLYFLVGKYQNHESKGLLRFSGITPDYDSAVVISATLKLKYANYYFQDSIGTTSFNIYPLTKSYDYSQVNVNTFLSSDIGSNSIGNYSGTLRDTASIYITLDNQAVKNWLEYAADTNFTNKNYGVAFVSNPGSTSIKGLYSSLTTADLKPTLTVIVSKNSKIDTLTLNTSSSVSLTNVPSTILMPDRFIVQNGFSYVDVLNFNLSKLPGRVIINYAALELKLDRANSFFNSGYEPKVNAYLLTDSTQLNFESNAFASTMLDSNTYSILLLPVIQRWNNGSIANLGIMINSVYDNINIDKSVFYSNTFSDASKRPRIKIRYTLRR